MRKIAQIVLFFAILFVFSACGGSSKSIEIIETKDKIEVGETFRIKYTVNPSDEKISFESSDTSIASVDVLGKVKGNKPGTVIITVSLVSDSSVNVTFTLKVGSSFSDVDFSEIPLDEDLWPVKELEKGSDEETIYMLLREQIANVARRDGTKTEFNLKNVPIKDSINLEQKIIKVLGLIWLSCPYDLYWYQEQDGYYLYYTNKGNIADITVKLPVSSDYRKSEYEIDNECKVIALNALKNAIKIANEASGSDYDKIMYFKNMICELVTYDTKSNNDQMAGKIKAGSNPWQMVSVFDNNSQTNVVCAGYSKAFKYLCDRVGIECKVVNGIAFGAPHVWNVVTLEGKNYIVDVTNCDSGTKGYPDKLILVGASGSIEDGYTPIGTNLNFRYYTSKDRGVTDMVNVFGEAGLVISETSYSKK